MKVKVWVGIGLCLVVAGVAAFLLFANGSHLEAAAARDELNVTAPVVAATEREGGEILRLLVWGGYDPGDLIAEFEQEMEEKYQRKVTLQFTRATSNDDFFGAIRGKETDLVTMSHYIIKDDRSEFIKKGLLIPPDLNNIPNFKNVINDLKKASYHTENEEVYGIPVANGPYGLGYNTAKVQPAPESWDVFWDPAYKGKYCIAAEEYVYNVNVAAMTFGYSDEEMSHYDSLNNKAFKAHLRQFAENAHSFWIGVDEADDLEGLSLATSWGDSFSELKRRGELWEMASPKEGTLWWVDDYCLTWALADQPFLKKIAEEWINKTLSSAYQLGHLVREIGIYPVTTSLADQMTPAERAKIHPESFADFFSSHSLQKTYSKRDRNGLKVLWDEAMVGLLSEKEAPVE
jgi:spermidine/putrescine-binding protein